uniref:Uncharacterized protein n=1 Tax=Anguilla anguilla TaxID=7936 RepID=A0A0E9V407_ANGAN
MFSALPQRGQSHLTYYLLMSTLVMHGGCH